MKLSILIPVHNYTCYKLVYDLHEQAERLGIDYEIIVAEDGSRSQVDIIANHKMIDLTNCRHIIRRENVGRAAIRNVLFRESTGDLLLFMDADGRVINENFLSAYIEASKEHAVVCGGIKCPEVCHDPHRSLRWRYERDYEKKHGYVSEQFRSFCFLIKRDVMSGLPFDERYKIYGYEDVQYGMDLEKAGYTVHAIDNPLENADIEDNCTFLKKTEEALRSAYMFRDEIGDRVEVVKLRKRLGILSLPIACFFMVFKKILRANLLSANPSLLVFKIYKLGYYCRIKTPVGFVRLR